MILPLGSPGIDPSTRLGAPGSIEQVRTRPTFSDLTSPAASSTLPGNRARVAGSRRSVPRPGRLSVMLAGPAAVAARGGKPRAATHFAHGFRCDDAPHQRRLACPWPTALRAGGTRASEVLAVTPHAPRSPTSRAQTEGQPP